MNELQARIEKIRAQIPEGVKLIAVSKTRSAEDIRQAYSFGLRDFGENYWQEAEGKIQQLMGLPDIRWHFIGQLQSKKLKFLIGRFDLIQSLCDLAHAEKLNELALDKGIQQDVLIQTNFGGESTKSGFLRDNVEQAIRSILAMEGLNLKGVMDMPPVFSEEQQAADFFEGHVHEIHRVAGICGWKPEVFSLGTSQDFRAAITAGSNMVRIGTEIFGPRPQRLED